MRFVREEWWIHKKIIFSRQKEEKNDFCFFGLNDWINESKFTLQSYQSSVIFIITRYYWNEKSEKMKASSHYLRAQNFSLPSLHNDNNNKLKYKSFHNHDRNFTNDDVLIYTNNIMFDSRVCRGNTYATPVLTEDQRRNKSVYERIQKSRRLSLLQKREESEVRWFSLF